MNISDIKPEENVKDVHFTDDNLSVDLMDGRTITVPIAWYPRLLHATREQRQKWKPPRFLSGVKTRPLCLFMTAQLVF